MTKARFFSILAALMLSACSSQPIEPRYFLLRGESPPASRPLQLDTGLVFPQVSIAPYIAQRGLLLEVAPGEIHAARHHLWAEPVSDGVYALLLDEIGRVSGRDLLPSSPEAGLARLMVRIDQFHGTREGDALLIAKWWIERSGAAEKASLFVQRRPLQRDGYAALVQAQRELLSALAHAIGTAIADAGGPSEPAP